jgi:acetone carboxylase gamma subunit
MKRYILILSLISCLTCSARLTELTRQNIPNYTDDSYYWPQADTTVSAMPVYDRNMREFIFLEDTVQYPDTVRMLIIEQ